MCVISLISMFQTMIFLRSFRPISSSPTAQYFEGGGSVCKCCADMSRRGRETTNSKGKCADEGHLPGDQTPPPTHLTNISFKRKNGGDCGVLRPALNQQNKSSLSCATNNNFSIHPFSTLTHTPKKKTKTYTPTP